MSCCGQPKPPLPPLRTAIQATSASPASRPRLAAIFEYTGGTGLTVIGPVSGRAYRFAGPGSRLRVELCDRPALLRLPALREVA